MALTIISSCVACKILRGVNPKGWLSGERPWTYGFAPWSQVRKPYVLSTSLGPTIKSFALDLIGNPQMSGEIGIPVLVGVHIS